MMTDILDKKFLDEYNNLSKKEKQFREELGLISDRKYELCKFSTIDKFKGKLFKITYNNERNTIVYIDVHDCYIEYNSIRLIGKMVEIEIHNNEIGDNFYEMKISTSFQNVVSLCFAGSIDYMIEEKNKQQYYKEISEWMTKFSD